MALANQYAGHALGFINPAMYRIGRDPADHKAFHDITAGDNTVTYSGVTVTGYQAAPGWDPVTGWGSPDAQVLAPSSPLMADAPAPPEAGYVSVGRSKSAWARKMGFSRDM